MKIETRYGARIKELREERGWTQEDLEVRAGVAVRTIQRVESNKTKDPGTLAAIASAFDVTVGDLARRYQVAESKPPKGLLIESATDFRIAIERAHHDFVIQRFTKTNDRVEELITSMTEDMQYVSPDEPELFNCFIQSLKDPLSELHSLGFGIFSIQETCDRFMKLGDEKAKCIEGWGRAHFVVVPRFGCFRLGDPSSGDKLHGFNADCPESIQKMLRIFREELQVGVFANALFAAFRQDGSTVPLNWCDSCFPIQPDGSRLTKKYFASVLGRTETELDSLLSDSWLDIPIVGHA